MPVNIFFRPVSCSKVALASIVADDIITPIHDILRLLDSAIPISPVLTFLLAAILLFISPTFFHLTAVYKKSPSMAWLPREANAGDAWSKVWNSWHFFRLDIPRRDQPQTLSMTPTLVVLHRFHHSRC